MNPLFRSLKTVIKRFAFKPGSKEFSPQFVLFAVLLMVLPAILYVFSLNSDDRSRARGLSAPLPSSMDTSFPAPSPIDPNVPIPNYYNGMSASKDRNPDNPPCPPQGVMPPQPSFAPNAIPVNVLVITWGNDYTYCDTYTLTHENKATWVERLLEIGTIHHGYQGGSGAQVNLNIVNVIRNYGEDIPGNTGELADYNTIFANEGVCNLVNTGQVDEVWIDTGGSPGAPNFYDSTLIGPADKIYNFGWGTAIVNDFCSKAVPTTFLRSSLSETNGSLVLLPSMGPSLLSFGHRFQSTLSHYLDNNGGYAYPQTLPDPDGTNDYIEEFDGLYCYQVPPAPPGPIDPPPLGQNSCGNADYPPNSLITGCNPGTRYYSTTTKLMDCTDWDPQHSGTAQLIACNTPGLGWANASGQCWQENYFAKWWFQNMPGKCNGLTKVNGEPMPNWWRLIFKGDAYGFDSCTDPSQNPGIEWPGYVQHGPPDETITFTASPMPVAGDKLHLHFDCNIAGGCSNPQFTWQTQKTDGTWVTDFTLTSLYNQCLGKVGGYDCVLPKTGPSGNTNQHKIIAVGTNWDFVACLNGSNCDAPPGGPSPTPMASATPTPTPLPSVSPSPSGIPAPTLNTGTPAYTCTPPPVTVNLYWYQVSGATQYEVVRCTSSSTCNPTTQSPLPIIATITPTTNPVSFNDTTAVNNAPNRYSVRGRNGGTFGAWSMPILQVTPFCSSPSPTPVPSSSPSPVPSPTPTPPPLPSPSVAPSPSGTPPPSGTPGTCQCDLWNVTVNGCGTGYVPICHNNQFTCACVWNQPGYQPGWCYTQPGASPSTCSNNSNCHSSTTCSNWNTSNSSWECGGSVCGSAPVGFRTDSANPMVNLFNALRNFFGF